MSSFALLLKSQTPEQSELINAFVKELERSKNTHVGSYGAMDDYGIGFYNGMEFARCLIKNQEAVYYEGPRVDKATNINCDTVSWMMDALERFKKVILGNRPSISRLSETAKMTAALELMEIFHLRLADRAAASNLLVPFPEIKNALNLHGERDVITSEETPKAACLVSKPATSGSMAYKQKLYSMGD
jgi:hypothetical protein